MGNIRQLGPDSPKNAFSGRWPGRRSKHLKEELQIGLAVGVSADEVLPYRKIGLRIEVPPLVAENLPDVAVEKADRLVVAEAVADCAYIEGIHDLARMNVVEQEGVAEFMNENPGPVPPDHDELAVFVVDRPRPPAYKVEAETIEGIHFVHRKGNVEGPAVGLHFIRELPQQFGSRRSLPSDGLPALDSHADARLPEEDPERLVKKLRRLPAVCTLVDDDDGRNVPYVPEFLLRRRALPDRSQAASGQHKKKRDGDRSRSPECAGSFRTDGQTFRTPPNPEYAGNPVRGPVPLVSPRCQKRKERLSTPLPVHAGLDTVCRCRRHRGISPFLLRKC